MSRPIMIRGLMVAVVLALTGLGTTVCLDMNRASGDVVLAGDAVEGLTFIQQSAVAMGDSTPYSNSVEDYFYAIDLFLASESRDRLPEVATHVERAWTAFKVADQLWRLAEEGETQPLASDVYAAQALIEDLPEVRAVLVGEGEAARFNNSNLEATDALFRAAAAERAAAAALVVQLETETGMR